MGLPLHSPRGALCAVAPLRCLRCRNSWVLPSQLPQLLLFAEHLEKVRRRLDPFPWELPYCSSRAIAFATSLIDRFCSVVPDRASSSKALSVPVARVVRCQSTTATLVLSPGASARLCSSRPSVTPWADQLC
ncbi:hypothetical protein [Streptomyces sp. A1547]|uniref:hypothetical protein n=1 Tax=Streptomyces sp. A1547 TaxID=2563105 RepID=UPI001F10B410|nr:hypothetical protein [Streptomyces sp. A1547]